MPIQYVTLVVQGGTPVRLADQTGAPYPTTGSGALVFANGGVLTNVTITGQVIPTPTILGRGTVSAPAISFGSSDNGIFSQMAGDVSVATGGNLLVSFQTNVASFAFPVSSTRLNLFSDSAGQTSLQSTDTGGGVHLLTLNKYGGNVAIGNNSAPVAGGSATNGNLLFTSSSVSISTGTGAPTFTAPRGSFYLRNDSSFVPYVNSDGTGTGWVQILSSGGTLNNPVITGTVTGGASYTAITLTNPTITGTVSGSATYSGVTITSGILVGSALGTPVSGTLTNTTGFPVANLAGAGAGVLTAMALAVTGSGGGIVVATGPTLSNPVVGTQSPGNNTTLAASTAFVTAAITALPSTAPTTQNLTSGSAATYTTPAGVKWIKVRVVGGGGGGSGAGGTTAPTGGTGGTTTFNSITAVGGTGGTGTTSTLAAGGIGGTGGTGTATLRTRGNAGGSATSTGTVLNMGGIGAGTQFGGAPAQTQTVNAGGNSGAANSGAGGGGANGGAGAAPVAGAGGGAGEYFELIISSPAGTYTYTIGAGGTGGIGTGTGAATGGAGGSGFITVEEHYNF